MEVILGFLLWMVIWLAPLAGLMFVGFGIIRRPMRRRERERMFLTLIDTGLKDGRSVEETIVSLARTRDPGLGPRFQALAGCLGTGQKLGDALDRVPGILPAQLVAMLKAGEKIGDLNKVMPACRQLLKDHLALTRSSINYLLVAAAVTTPAAIFILTMLQVVVLPKFQEIARQMEVVNPVGIEFLLALRGPLLFVQFLLLLAVWLTAFVYVGGPALTNWQQWGIGPAMDRLLYALPWRRKRMERDFSQMLAILLDAGVPEPEALTLAADCAANEFFSQRAAEARAGLARGLKLAEAIQLMDDTGEFRWCLANALQSGGGFFKAIQGWTESLEAKASQQEQATASVITAGLVVLNGAFVGVIVVSVFSVVVAIINQGVLW